MFEIRFKPTAIRQLQKMKRYYSAAIIDAIEKHLREEPERAHDAIKRFRGRQAAIFRLRVQDYRVFYDCH
jgi:mRNA interferase RelE/StbE